LSRTHEIVENKKDLFNCESSPAKSSPILSFLTNKLSASQNNTNYEKEAERDEYELTYKTQRAETMTNSDMYYQPHNRHLYSTAPNNRLDSERTNGVATDSTVTPEQSVLHYNQPYTMDFSAVPFHLVAAAAGISGVPNNHNRLNSSPHQPPPAVVYPQSSSTPAPHSIHNTVGGGGLIGVGGRNSHTPPTKHNSASAFQTVNPEIDPTISTTSAAFAQPTTGLLSSSVLNTKAPMSMTDEEFRAAFIPNTPHLEPSLIAMQH